MVIIFTLIGIWAAGGFASIGALKGLSMVDGQQIDNEICKEKFLLSWYAFGQIILIMLAEVGNKIPDNTKK